VLPVRRVLIVASVILVRILKEESVAYETQPFTVRVVYVVPVDSEPWEDAEHRATECLEDIQWFFADEMKRLGYAAKTFEIAKDEGGTGVFHRIGSPLKREEFGKNYWEKCKKAAQAHGLRGTSDVVVYFYESYTVTNDEVSGAGARGKRSGVGGEAFLSSLHLKLARREWIANDNGYEGEVFDWVLPGPMKSNTLSWHGRGKKLGDVSGSAFGVISHELGHAFGLPHDSPLGKNRQGTLMGRGFRGMRGYFRPDLTNDFCTLSEQSAELLVNNDFFAVRRLRPKSIAFSSEIAG
jgi:hypothetical protein